jgi:hypothetical protein
MTQYNTTKVVIVVAVAVLLSNSEALVKFHNCTGLTDQTKFWKNMTNGYNKVEPPAIDFLDVYVRVYVTSLGKLDPILRSGKVVYRTRYSSFLYENLV